LDKRTAANVESFANGGVKGAPVMLAFATVSERELRFAKHSALQRIPAVEVDIEIVRLVNPHIGIGISSHPADALPTVDQDDLPIARKAASR
jgi:hypothetical protein